MIWFDVDLNGPANQVIELFITNERRVCVGNNCVTDTLDCDDSPKAGSGALADWLFASSCDFAQATLALHTIGVFFCALSIAAGIVHAFLPIYSWGHLAASSLCGATWLFVFIAAVIYGAGVSAAWDDDWGSGNVGTGLGLESGAVALTFGATLLHLLCHALVRRHGPSTTDNGGKGESGPLDKSVDVTAGGATRKSKEDVWSMWHDSPAHARPTNNSEPSALTFQREVLSDGQWSTPTIPLSAAFPRNGVPPNTVTHGFPRYPDPRPRRHSPPLPIQGMHGGMSHARGVPGPPQMMGRGTPGGRGWALGFVQPEPWAGMSNRGSPSRQGSPPRLMQPLAGHGNAPGYDTNVFPKARWENVATLQGGGGGQEVKDMWTFAGAGSSPPTLELPPVLNPYTPPHTQMRDIRRLSVDSQASEAGL
mmetsp:Transcript_38922/g.91084  ORF Transcript_38922/g.91084 Transcript_38922/m.91084 type:complete len:422 (+) Transcript_38922:1-1266(+)